MNAMTLSRNVAAIGAPHGTADMLVHEDPLDEDHPSDLQVTTTRRGLTRLALVAAETGARFQREAMHHDPMAWMLSPLTLFGGAAALEACLQRDACVRGILIHGLSLGLDADPMAIDALTSDDDESEDDEDAVWSSHAVGRSGGSRSTVAGFGGPEEVRPPRLFTATMVANDGFETVQAFHASLAIDEAEVAGRLYCRIGAASAGARIVEGFDPTDPLVTALVSDAICDTLSIVASEPESSLAAGLDLNIEQRFLC